MVYPGEGFDPLATLKRSRPERCTALYGVPTMFIAELDHPEFARFDLHIAAHRHHGRLALPDRGDEARATTEMNMREVTIAYGMTETSPVSFQSAGRRSAGTAGVDRRAHPSACRGQDRRSRGPHRAARHAGRTLHPRLQRDARLLGRGGEHRRSDRRARLDAYRRSRDDRRGGLLQHRRPHQGHGDPRRREHLSARDRGVPLPASRRSRTCRCSASPTTATARSSAPGSGRRSGATLDEEEIRAFCQGQIAHYKIPRYVDSSTNFR